MWERVLRAWTAARPTTMLHRWAGAWSEHYPRCHAGVKGQLADMDHSYAPPTETEDEPDVLIRLRAEVTH